LLINDFKKFATASNKHEHLKGLIGQFYVLALTGGACVMLPNLSSSGFSSTLTVKRVDKVVRHPHLLTQDQNTQVSNKVFDIPEENFTINIELFRLFSQVSN
jgi:hypothetical protein